MDWVNPEEKTLEICKIKVVNIAPCGRVAKSVDTEQGSSPGVDLRKQRHVACSFPCRLD